MNKKHSNLIHLIVNEICLIIINKFPEEIEDYILEKIPDDFPKKKIFSIMNNIINFFTNKYHGIFNNEYFGYILSELYKIILSEYEMIMIRNKFNDEYDKMIDILVGKKLR